MQSSLLALAFGSLFLFIFHSTSASGLENLRCLICKQIVQDTQEAIKNVDPKKKVEVGNYRLDAKGNSQQNVIPYALSEMHIADTLEAVCKGIDDYIRAIHKKTGELVLLKLIVNGAMNTEMSEVDVIQDGDLNKSLKYYCDGIVEEYEESIIKMFQNKVTNVEEELCTKEAKLCSTSKIKHEDL